MTLRRKPKGRAIPIPDWANLPKYAQADLAARGYDEAWFASHEDRLRLTVLNLYVKMKGMGLWNLVSDENGAQIGALQFLCTNVDTLKNVLRTREDFTSPEASPNQWSSREMRATAQLHFKHFSGWPASVIQAHIDPHGLLLKSKWWWAFPIIPLGQMVIHGLNQEGYRDVIGIRDLLLSQGWDPTPLKGI